MSTPDGFPTRPRNTPREYPEFPTYDPGVYPPPRPGPPGCSLQNPNACFPHDPRPHPTPVPPRRPAPELGQLFSIDPVPLQPRSPPSVNSPRPVVPTQSPWIFGSAAPSPAPAPRPRRRPARRRTRPARRGRPERRPSPRIPFPEPPSAPTPDSPPARRPTPRKLPLPSSVPDALFDLWRRLWDEYLMPRDIFERVRRGSRSPRRGGARTRQPTPPGRVTVPMPGPLPVDLPTPQGRPTPSEIFQPPAALPSPFPDPSAFPATVPSAPPASAPGRRLSRRRLVNVEPFLPFSVPQVRLGSRRNPRRDPGRTSPGTGRLRDLGRLGQLLQPSARPGLTPLQQGRLDLPSQPSSDPCAQRARDAKRRQRKKRKECKKFVTKEIRVCQSSNAK